MIALGKYRHYKGREYEVLAIAKHSETLASMVVYRALYGDAGVWVRPLEMFQETVMVDGDVVPRFLRVDLSQNTSSDEGIRS